MGDFEPGECIARTAADPVGYYAVMLYNYYEKSIPPRAGGLAEQGNWEVEAIEIVRAWVEDRRKKK